MRTAAAQSSQLHADEAAGDGAVTLHAQRERDEAGGLQPLGHRAHAVGRVGKAVEQQRTAAYLRRNHDLRAVEVGGEPRGRAAAGRHVAIRHQGIGAFGDSRIHLCPGLGEHHLFAPQVVVQREDRADVNGARLEAGHQVMPGLQIRQAAHRRHGAPDGERRHQSRHRAHHANGPSPQHACSVPRRAARNPVVAPSDPCRHGRGMRRLPAVRGRLARADRSAPVGTRAR